MSLQTSAVYRAIEEIYSRDWEADQHQAFGAQLELGRRAYLSRHVIEALAADIVAAGVDADAVSTEIRVGLTGGYGVRPRAWDVVVLGEDMPVALVELKFIRGSLGNNLRNRIDEFVALATSVSAAFEGVDRAPYRPCLAIICIVEGALETDKRSITGHPEALCFPGDKPGEQMTYAEALGATLSRMLDDGLLDAACYLSVDAERGHAAEPFGEQLSYDAFISNMLNHMARAIRRRVGDEASAVGLGRAFSRGAHVEQVVSGIVSTPEGLSAAEAAVVRERRRVVADLQQLALRPDVNETKMHHAIGAQYWLFGGQYIGVLDRRTLVTLDQYDIPLICADGSLQIVELKGPESQLVRKHRNHLIVANEVHAAVNQCLNYLRGLDEEGAALRTKLRNELAVDLDFRRAKATVVIGHPDRSSSPDATREQVDQAFARIMHI